MFFSNIAYVKNRLVRQGGKHTQLEQVLFQSGELEQRLQRIRKILQRSHLLRMCGVLIVDELQEIFHGHLNRWVCLDLPQIHAYSRHLVLEASRAFGELEERMRDRSYADGKGRKGKEHEKHDVQPLEQIHWRHLRRHGSHHPKSPVDAKHVLLDAAAVSPRPGTIRPLELGRGPVRFRISFITEVASRLPDKPPDASIPMTDAEHDDDDSRERNGLLENERTETRLHTFPHGRQLRQPRHPHQSQESEELHQLR
mmetsp:Transcript_14515/g.39814  ORF Transcript_14515/g.39814 Transcript_14515/m.39814 type:complete len:255 (-) Transcript_14515:1151-1915(-)